MSALLDAALETLRGPFVRALMVGVLVLLLQIPSCMIGNLTRERQQSRDTAAEDVARTWGGRQQVLGPFLVVPYRITGKDDKGNTVTRESGQVVVLPEQLDVRASAAVEPRRRGLFEIPVYHARVRLSGRFRAPHEDAARVVPSDTLSWKDAQLVVQLGNVHAIDRAAPLQWNGASHAFEAGGGALYVPGVHAPLTGLRAASPAEFSAEIELRGSQALHIAPLGRETVARLESNWPHPSFGGAWLPAEREVGDRGFAATWRVTHLARGLPDAWKNGAVDDKTLNGTLFGVDLLRPVDPYRMSERSVKYNTLFVGLTFLVIWLFEVMARRRVPMLQYLLLGSALCLFYLLELSLAEHLGFVAAYALAAGAVTAQVTLYARAALPARRAAHALGAVVAGLYGLLYVLLREEDYALLVGSGFLFVVLSLVMFLTRGLSSPSREASPAP